MTFAVAVARLPAGSEAETLIVAFAFPSSLSRPIQRSLRLGATASELDLARTALLAAGAERQVVGLL